MSMQTNRKKDYMKNRLMNEFFDKKLYTKPGFSNVLREETRDRQLMGVDVEFDYNGQHYVCDEKATTDDKYINGRFKLNTFCLELSSLQGNEEIEREGWLLRSDNINDSYLFAWIDKADDSNILNCGLDGIREVEISLVRKAKILEYLESIGWTKDKLKKKSKAIREENDRNFGNIKENGCKFSYSEFNKGEKPINVLLSREVYRGISDFNTIIRL